MLLVVGLLAWLGLGHRHVTPETAKPLVGWSLPEGAVFSALAPEAEHATLNAGVGVSVPTAIWRAIRFVVLAGSFNDGRFAPHHRPPPLAWVVCPATPCPIQDWLVWTGQRGLAPPTFA